MYEQNGLEWPEGHIFEACREFYNGNELSSDCISGCHGTYGATIYTPSCADGFKYVGGPWNSWIYEGSNKVSLC